MLFSGSCVEYSKFTGKDQPADVGMCGQGIAGNLKRAIVPGSVRIGISRERRRAAEGSREDRQP